MVLFIPLYKKFTDNPGFGPDKTFTDQEGS